MPTIDRRGASILQIFVEAHNRMSSPGMDETISKIGREHLVNRFWQELRSLPGFSEVTIVNLFKDGLVLTEEGFKRMPQEDLQKYKREQILDSGRKRD